MLTNDKKSMEIVSCAKVDFLKTAKDTWDKAKEVQERIDEMVEEINLRSKGTKDSLRDFVLIYSTGAESELDTYCGQAEDLATKLIDACSTANNYKAALENEKETLRNMAEIYHKLMSRLEASIMDISTWYGSNGTVSIESCKGDRPRSRQQRGAF